MTKNDTQSSSAPNKISKDIADASQATNEMASNGSQVNNSAGQLSVLSDELKKTIDQFKI